MDDDTAVGGPEVDEEQTEEDRGISAPTASRASRRVRIIGAEQAGSVVPPEGFAVTEDPLESDLFDEPSSPALSDPLHDELAGLEDPGELDLEWSPAQPRSEYESELPHWTDPPTGQVPAVLARDEPDLPEWQRAGDTGPVWREHRHDWADPGFEPSMLGDEETRVGELRTEDLAEERRPWEFSDDDAFADEDADEGSDDERQAVTGALDSLSSGAVTTISSSVRKLGPGPTREAAGRPRRGRRRQSFGEAVPEPAAAPQGAGSHSARTPHPFDPPSDGGSGRNMSIAIATGVAVSAVALLCMWGGPVPTLVLSTVVVTLCAAEAYGTLRRSGHRSATLLGLVATVGIMVTAYVKGPSAVPLMVVLLLVGTMLWYLIGVEHGSPVEGTASTVFVFIWVGVLGSFAALLLAPSQYPDRHGVAFFAGAIIAAVLNDVGALIAGRWFGRHLLAPRVSPRKTWEGLVGGAVLTIAGSILITGHIHPWTIPKAAVLGVVVAVVAPVGDLCESLVKRDLSLKDMGSLLPGHGGLLDRFDALLFVLPATYYLVRLVHLG
ncbi:MAG: phosphatidate cytidylyltransferase [Acidimicrobiales bacterium]